MRTSPRYGQIGRDSLWNSGTSSDHTDQSGWRSLRVALSLWQTRQQVGCMKCCSKTAHRRRASLHMSPDHPPVKAAKHPCTLHDGGASEHRQAHRIRLEQMFRHSKLGPAAPSARERAQKPQTTEAFLRQADRGMRRSDAFMRVLQTTAARCLTPCIASISAPSEAIMNARGAHKPVQPSTVPHAVPRVQSAAPHHLTAALER